MARGIDTPVWEFRATCCKGKIQTSSMAAAQTFGGIQKVDPPWGSVVYTSGVLEARIVLYYILLYYTILCYTVLYHIIPYYTILYQKSSRVQNPKLYFLDPPGGLGCNSISWGLTNLKIQIHLCQQHRFPRLEAGPILKQGPD